LEQILKAYATFTFDDGKFSWFLTLQNGLSLTMWLIGAHQSDNARCPNPTHGMRAILAPQNASLSRSEKKNGCSSATEGLEMALPMALQITAFV